MENVLTICGMVWALLVMLATFCYGVFTVVTWCARAIAKQHAKRLVKYYYPKVTLPKHK